jgi:probable rRNA maturation factor
MISIEVREPFEGEFDPGMLEQAVQVVYLHQSVPPETGLTLLVSDTDELRQLNRQFLGIDESTDVLAFPAGHTDPDTGERYLGDVVISHPHAQAQASTAGHPVEAEMQLLAVHGVLHLLGYDHADDEEKNRMWAVQSEILASLGLPADLQI